MVLRYLLSQAPRTADERLLLAGCGLSPESASGQKLPFSSVYETRGHSSPTSTILIINLCFSF